MRPLKDFHEPYLAENEEICQLVESRQARTAAKRLKSYLVQAREQLLAAYRSHYSPPINVA
jgi:hypothetical protein